MIVSATGNCETFHSPTQDSGMSCIHFTHYVNKEGLVPLPVSFDTTPGEVWMVDFGLVAKQRPVLVMAFPRPQDMPVCWSPDTTLGPHSARKRFSRRTPD